MPATILKTPQAKIDLVSVAGHIAEDSLDAALRFLDAAELAFRRLADRPEMGTVCHFRSAQAARIREWSIKGFQNYLIFYRPIDEGIEVIRVLHGARDLDTLFANETDD